MILDPRELFARAAAAQSEVPKLGRPPAEGTESLTEQVFPSSIVARTEYYIEKIANQINGCYERGWFDACAVMIRRLLETLIIEVFEAKGLAAKIRDSKGDYFMLGDLVTEILKEPSIALGRSTKRALPKLKDVGNLSAHSRRYVAHVRDIDSNSHDIRVVVQELVLLAGLKKA